MSVAYKPFFSTSYGDTFGYNEREGFNPRTFRNRYLDPLYEPATTATAYNRFNDSAPLSATAAAATIHAPPNRAYSAPSGAAAPQAAYQFQPHPPTSSKPALYTAAPFAAAGGAFAPAFSRSAPINSVYDQNVRVRYNNNNLGFDPISAPAHQSFQSLPAGDWSYSNTSSSALLTLPAGVYDIKPALRWSGKSPRPAAIGPGNGPLPHPHPLLPSYDTDSYGKRDPAQQIPFGRLNALKPHELYERELKENPHYYLSSGHLSNYNRPGLEAHKIESAQNYGKLSISRRVESSRLRYGQ